MGNVFLKLCDSKIIFYKVKINLKTVNNQILKLIDILQLFRNNSYSSTEFL